MRDITHELPTVRLHKVLLEGFKSVEYGEIETACAKKFIPLGTKSDILGIYGQNGSGKTSVIEALSIFKYLASGASIPDGYVDCIKIDAEEAHLEFTFDFQYPSGKIHKVIYGVYLAAKKEDTGSTDTDEELVEDLEDESDRHSRHLVKVLREYIKVSGDIEGRKGIHTAIDTKYDPFGPMAQRKYFLKDSKKLKTLRANKLVAQNMSKSFLFMHETKEIFIEMMDENAHDLDFISIAIPACIH